MQPFPSVRRPLDCAPLWNTYEITAKGSKLTVVLNGQKTAETDNVRHGSDFIALQDGSSVVEFRKIEIQPL